MVARNFPMEHFPLGKRKKKKFIKTSSLINLAKILMKTRQVSIGKLLHFLIALLQSSQQADGNLGIKKPWVLKPQTSKFTSQVCKAPCQLGKSPGKLPWIYSNPVASQVSSSLRSLLAVGKPDSRTPSLPVLRTSGIWWKPGYIY